MVRIWEVNWKQKALNLKAIVVEEILSRSGLKAEPKLA